MRLEWEGFLQDEPALLHRDRLHQALSPHDDSGLELWYVALTTTHQQDTIMLESSSSEKDAGSPAIPSHVEKVWVKFNMS
jgi:hypothetical protein